MRWLIIPLLCLAGCGGGTDPAPPQPAQSISWDFETGTFPHGSVPGGFIYPNMVAPVVLLEGPPHLHFARLTASPPDCGDTFNTTCPRTRAEMWMGGLPDVMGATRTYAFSMRLPSSNPPGQDALLWQTFEGDPPNTNRDIWLGVQNGRVYLANAVQPVPQTSQTVDLGGIGGISQVVDLGPIVYDQWNTYQVVVLLATDTTGTVTVWKNGVEMGTITGQPTKYFTNHTDVYLNVVDEGGTLGIVDFDDVQQQTNPR